MLNVYDLAIVRCDVEGRVVFINRAFQRLFQVSPGEVMGEGYINVLHPENRDEIYAKWKRAVEQKREFSENILYLLGDGTSMLAHATMFKEVDRRGKVRGYLGYIAPMERNNES